MALTDTACRNAKPAEKPRKLADEKGLYLLVNRVGKYWRMDYRYAGKRKTMALGVYPEVSLSGARVGRDEARRRLAAGDDPMAARHEEKRRKRHAAENSFEVVAKDWLRVRAARWAAVTAEKTRTHLEGDVYPSIGHRPVSEITPPELLALLRKIESRGATYTATRIREICGQVFRFAIATGRATYNPAADLAGAIVAPAVRHRPAITDKREFGQFLRDLGSFSGADRLTLLATRLALLTFVRSQELRFARWGEFDLEAREWRVPAGRMKVGKTLNQAHVVPLSPQAVGVLRDLRELSPMGDLLLPNSNGDDAVISENTIGRMLKRMGYGGRQTLHGFRASARSLLSERGWSVAALERQLDHAERSKVVAAYARSEHLDERRQMMDDWGALVQALEAGDNVVPIARVA